MKKIILLIILLTFASCNNRTTNTEYIQVHLVDINARTYVVVDKKTEQVFIIFNKQEQDVVKYDPKKNIFTKYAEEKE